MSVEGDYVYLGTYSLSTFEKLFTEKFNKNPRYNASAVPDMLKLVDMIGRDPNITDVRWGAYMLATVFWETTSPVTFQVQAKDKKGKPLFDKAGNPVMLKQRKWAMTMAPVDEVGHGKGRNYHEPVKVESLADGTVKITEQDGDQFSVASDGTVKNLTKGAKMGTADGGPAVKVYQTNSGTEHAYYGRGYVQLTWWSNYAKAGVAIGKGLNLLLDPELVKDPATAYELMSHGMRTGQGFANGHKFAKFFKGETKDYVGARKMVNGNDHAADIAKLAQSFEDILMGSRIVRRAAPLPFFAPY